MQPALPLSQMEYVTYTRYLDEIAVIEKCCRKGELYKIGFLNGRFFKVDVHPSQTFNSLFECLSSNELAQLKNKVRFINDVHHKLETGKLKERGSDDCAPLAAEVYNTRLKTVLVWNSIFKGDLKIDLPNGNATVLDPAFTDKTTAQCTDDKALSRYFELLEKYPSLKREGDLNDFKKGAYQIVYDPKEIASIRQEVYQRLYGKSISQGMTHLQADDLATSFSRPGVVCEDQFWLWIRDVVISPQGFKHTYNRIVWKCNLDRIGGVATLPVVDDHQQKKIVVQVAFRHATQSWEFEIPRGASKANETPLDTAKRETLEETGYQTDALVNLGSITPDSGLTATVVPVFLGHVTIEEKAKHDKTEAIKGKYAFTLVELMDGFRRGYMEVEINGQITQVPMRDPFLAYALLMGQYQGHLL